jgi:diacylglycerol kinase family enzyme
LSQLHLSPQEFPQIGLLPLGTANELCRVTGWRIPIDPDNFDFQSILRTIFTSESFLVDKWLVSVTNPSDHSKNKLLRMLCFASIGQDAKITHHFQEQRDRDPKSTGTVIKNKYWYAHYGMKAALSPSNPTFKVLNLQADDKPIPIPEDFQTLQILNISTMADGINFWYE